MTPIDVLKAAHRARHRMRDNNLTQMFIGIELFMELRQHSDAYMYFRPDEDGWIFAGYKVRVVTEPLSAYHCLEFV